MLNFNFSEKGLGLVSLPHFVYDSSRKMFVVLHFINWPRFIVRLLLLLEMGNMYIIIVCELCFDVIKSEINLIFLIKPFRYMSKKSRQKLKYLENEKSCCGEIKSIFDLFKSAFSCQKLSQTWECSIKICRMCVVNSSVKILNYY